MSLPLFAVAIFLISDSQLVHCREPPLVSLPEQGTLLGTYLTMYRVQRIIGYLGVPYAHAPIGQLRFAPPSVDPPPGWDGTRNATRFGPDCWQPAEETEEQRPGGKYGEFLESLLQRKVKEEDLPDEPYDEDCLLLNIYVPDGPPPPEGFSVAVWLHPGDFVRGSANAMDPFQLVFKQKIIVVAVAYRLGIFGFLTTIDGEAPGNFGLMDQAAALRWVNRNIEFFGGNKDSVCLFGHGSGAVSATLHMTSGDWSNEMFHRVIAMSGNALTEGTVQDPKRHMRTLNKVAYLFGCFRRPTYNLIACLRNVKASSLLQQTQRIAMWGPVLDAGLSNSTISFIQDDPRAMFERGQFTHVPILTGYTDGEDALSYAGNEMEESGIDPSHFESMLGDTVLSEMPPADNQSCPLDHQHVVDAVSFFYSPQPPSEDPEDLRKRYVNFMTEKHYGAPAFLLASLASRHATAFAYRFDLKPRTAAATAGLPEWSGVPHKMDLAFVWGIPYWGTFADGATGWDSADKRVADIVMTFWANFIKYTNPTQIGVYIRWDNFTAKSPGFLVIDRSFNMSHATTMNYKAFEFWNEYFPKVLDVSTNCCNMTDIAATNVRTSVSTVAGMLMCSFITYLFIT